MTAIGGLSALLYLAIPAARQKVPLPDSVAFDLVCGVGDLRSLALRSPAECEFIEGLKEFNVTFTNCTECEVFRYVCVYVNVCVCKKDYIVLINVCV